MTHPSPEGAIPDGAYVGTPGQSNSITDLNNLTQAEAEARMRAPVAGSFDNQVGSLWGLVDSMAAAITGQTPAGDPLEYIENWLADERANTGAVITDYGNELDRLEISKVESWAVPTVSPLSQTINRRADATFQLSDLMVPPMSGTDSRGDTVTTAAGRLQKGGDVKGRAYLAFLTPAITRAYKFLNFMVSEVASPACRMDVAVYVVNPEDRTLTRQVLQTEVSIPFGESVASVEFTDTWIAVQGSYIAVVWLQHGTGNPRTLLGLLDTPRPLPGNLYPRKIAAMHTNTGMTSLPTTIDGETQTDFSPMFTPYAELSEDIGVELRMVSDTFTSPTNRYLARPWVGLTSDKVWNANNGWSGIPEIFNIAAGPRAALYDTPLSTDRVQVSGRALRNNAVGPGKFSFLALRTTNNMNIGVGVFYSTDTIQIRSWVAGGAEQVHLMSTVRASTPWTLTDIREFTATWEDGEVAVYDENNVAILSWTDTITQQVARYRFVGIGFERTGGNSSPRLDHWAARDLPIEDDEEETEP